MISGNGCFVEGKDSFCSRVKKVDGIPRCDGGNAEVCLYSGYKDIATYFREAGGGTIMGKMDGGLPRNRS